MPVRTLFFSLTPRPTSIKATPKSASFSTISFLDFPLSIGCDRPGRPASAARLSDQIDARVDAAHVVIEIEPRDRGGYQSLVRHPRRRAEVVRELKLLDELRVVHVPPRGQR
jgi:hypothetical protein